jgi:hypothetical protein
MPIGGFSGFPAVSLPRPRFLPYFVAKPMIARDFSAQSEPREIFYPGFPCAAGKGRGGVALSAQRGVLALGVAKAAGMSTTMSAGFAKIAAERSCRAAKSPMIMPRNV